MKPFFKSKKFWATFTGCAVAIGANYLGIDEATTTKLMGMLGAYVMGQGIADLGKK